MNPATARILTHGVHVLTFVVLLVSGVLLLDPGLRSAVTGGYALTLGAVHRWSGVVFAVVPAAIAVAVGARRVLAPADWGRRRGYVQSAHTIVTVAMVVAFTLTGAVLWKRDGLSMALVDRAQDLHDALTYVGAALLGVHLFDIAVVAFLSRWHAATSP